jgi:hypothetical protein
MEPIWPSLVKGGPVNGMNFFFFKKKKKLYIYYLVKNNIFYF